MHIAPIGNTVWICCVYNFQTLFRGFFFCSPRIAYSNAGWFGASIGNACCKIEKTSTKLPHFAYLWGHRLIDFALLAGTGNRWKSKTTAKLKRETNLDRHGPRPITPTFAIFSAPLPSFCRLPLKVITNEKRGGFSVVSFDRSPFQLFSLKFSTNWCRPHPVRGIKLIREPCFYYLQSIFLSQ